MKTTIGLLIFLFIGAQCFAETKANESFFSRNQKFDKEGIELYSSNLDLKKHKKFGMGLSVGGASGILGLSSELNLDPENVLVFGIGTGPSYGSFNLQYKNNYESMYLSPYTKLGYSKWFRASNNSTSAQNSDILKRLFSEKDLKSGNYDADFFVGAVGAEYNQLEGELSGVNFYGELVVLTELRTAKIIPTGALGLIYFY